MYAARDTYLLAELVTAALSAGERGGEKEVYCQKYRATRVSVQAKVLSAMLSIHPCSLLVGLQLLELCSLKTDITKQLCSV